MAATIGVDTVTSISRRFIFPEIIDNIYNSNALFYRLNKANRKMVFGTQIEVPIMYAAMSAGGPYQGYDTLTMTPSDTVVNAKFDWKQSYVPIVVDGLTLIKADSPDAVANLLRLQFQQAEEQMCENLGVGIWSDGATNAKQITGLRLAVDSTGTYGGLNRSTYSGWAARQAPMVTTTTSILNTSHLACTEGGRAPSTHGRRLAE